MSDDRVAFGRVHHNAVALLARLLFCMYRRRAPGLRIMVNTCPVAVLGGGLPPYFKAEKSEISNQNILLRK
jgi:hypothetical protein